jgi:hypothetical protein
MKIINFWRVNYLTHVMGTVHERCKFCTKWDTSDRKHFIQFIEIFWDYVRFEVLTAVTMKFTVLWDATPCSSCNNRRFEERIASIIRIKISLILFTLVIEVTRSHEKSFLTRTTRSNIPGAGILYSHRRENLEPYTTLTGWAL